MSRRVIQHESARGDLEEYSEFIRRRNPRAALRFLDQVEATCRLLAGMPGIGTLRPPVHPGLIDLRSFPVSRFPKYQIFYRPIAGGIEVLRVLHGARDLDSLLGAGGDPPT